MGSTKEATSMSSSPTATSGKRPLTAEAAEERRLRDLLRSKMRKKEEPVVQPPPVQTPAPPKPTPTDKKSPQDAPNSNFKEPSSSMRSREPSPSSESSQERSRSRNSRSRHSMNSHRDRHPRDGRRSGPPYAGGRGGYGYHDGPWRGPPPPGPPYRGAPMGPGRWPRGPPPPRDRYGRLPPYDRRGPPPPGYYEHGGHRSRSRSRSPRGYRGRHRHRRRSPSEQSGSSRSVSSRSASRSVSSRSRSRSRSLSNNRRGRDSPRSSSPPSRQRRGHGRRGRSESYDSDSGSSSGSSSSSSSDEEPLEETLTRNDHSEFSKDQRTVFVSQLVMRANEKDIRRYFRRKVGCYVKDVILLRDKRTGNHKGCAYVELGRVEDVHKAVNVTGQPPDFQRFPILVKPSESEKNYVAQSSSVVTASMMGASTTSAQLLSDDGKMIESQKVYVGGLDTGVSEEHIFALFSQFGQLEKVSMQIDPATRISKGYAFLSFRDPKEANLAIQTMNNQVLAGRTMKTGWASQVSTSNGVQVVTSTAFPDEAADRACRALAVLAKLSGISLAKGGASGAAEQTNDAAMVGAKTSSAAAVPTVAEARANLAASQATTHVASIAAPAVEQPKMIGGIENPTAYILVHNMFDKDEETGTEWPTEIKEDFEEECSKFGKILTITVMSQEPGGKIYANFDSVDAALKCANNLAGRWFDKRQLRVDFVEAKDMPKE